jgi:hypothetical protein
MAFKKKIKRKVWEFAVYEIITTIAKIVYFSGLALLIPLIPLVFSPFDLIGAKNSLAIASVLIVVSFFIVYIFTKSKKVALRALGFMTLLPGFLAVVFSFMGPMRKAQLLGYFSKAPFVKEWVQEYVPSAWLLAGVYIVLGCALWYWSEKVRH